MKPHKHWFLLLFFCVTTASQAMPAQKNKPTAFHRAFTAFFGLPPQDLKLKNFIKNSLPNLISVGFRPAAQKVHITCVHRTSPPASQKWGLKTEAVIALAILFLRVLALGFTHIYKKSPGKPFCKTAQETTRNTVFALIHAALSSEGTKTALAEMKKQHHPWHLTAHRSYAVALLALECFYFIRRFKNAYQRRAFLHRMRKSSAAKAFVKSRCVPTPMVGKKYLTIQSPAGYLIKNGEEIVARAHTIASLMYHAVNGAWLESFTASPWWQTAQTKKQMLADFLTKPRIPHLQLTTHVNRTRPASPTTNTAISLATMLCDIPYTPHIYILTQDVRCLSKADQLELNTFVREDHLHAITRIHNYLQPLTKPL